MPDVVRRLQEIADSRDSKPADIAKAITMLANLADRFNGFVVEEVSNDIVAASANDQKSREFGS